MLRYFSSSTDLSYGEASDDIAFLFAKIHISYGIWLAFHVGHPANINPIISPMRSRSFSRSPFLLPPTFSSLPQIGAEETDSVSIVSKCYTMNCLAHAESRSAMRCLQSGFSEQNYLVVGTGYSRFVTELF